MGKNTTYTTGYLKAKVARIQSTTLFMSTYIATRRYTGNLVEPDAWRGYAEIHGKWDML